MFGGLEKQVVASFCSFSGQSARTGERPTGKFGLDATGFAQLPADADADGASALSTQIRPATNAASAAGQTYQALR